MELQEIDVFIEKDGQVRIEVRGVKGGSCLEITAALEQALGGQIAEREMTAESDEAAEQRLQDNLTVKS
jgi:Protein of unknown function (DUF2997)